MENAAFDIRKKYYRIQSFEIFLHDVKLCSKLFTNVIAAARGGSPARYSRNLRIDSSMNPFCRHIVEEGSQAFKGSFGFALTWRPI